MVTQQFTNGFIGKPILIIQIGEKAELEVSKRMLSHADWQRFLLDWEVETDKWHGSEPLDVQTKIAIVTRPLSDIKANIKFSKTHDYKENYDRYTYFVHEPELEQHIEYRPEPLDPQKWSDLYSIIQPNDTWNGIANDPDVLLPLLNLLHQDEISKNRDAVSGLISRFSDTDLSSKTREALKQIQSVL